MASSLMQLCFDHGPACVTVTFNGSQSHPIYHLVGVLYIGAMELEGYTCSPMGVIYRMGAMEGYTCRPMALI